MTDLQLSSQTTKKYDLPLSHLDYDYIEKCTNEKELEKILRVLRSGDEGKFPELERFAEKRLESICPKSRLLRKDGPILKPSDLSSGDWQAIEQDLKKWTNDMQSKDEVKVSGKAAKGQQEILEGDENLPPVRSSNIVLEGKKQKKPETSKKKRVMPRDYKEWDKVDVDAELEKIESDENNKIKAIPKSSVKGINQEIDASGMSHEERQLKANREKDKGNEAYRSGDFEESVTYYSRSISLIPNAASFNNRALAYLKLEKWDKAIHDCNSVLNLEMDNIKALLRRGTAFKSKSQLSKAKEDFDKVLKLEPNNKKAESLLEEIQKAEKEKKEKGRRMVIEEIEEDSDSEEEIQVESPMVNGHSSLEDMKFEKSPSPIDSGKERGTEKENQESSREGPSSVITSLKGNHGVSKNFEESKIPASALSSVPDTSSTSQTKTDTTHSCSKEILPDLEPPSSTPPSEISALPQANVQLPSSSSSSPDDNVLSQESPSDTKVENLSHLPSPTSAATDESPFKAPSASSENPPEFVRPQLVQPPLSLEVTKLKEEGNNLFRSGQYGNAAAIYSKAVAKLEKDPSQFVNLSLILSNRAACHLKTGNSRQAVADCDLSLQHVPHGMKSLLRRAAAFETMEKYCDAYKDYKHVLSIDGTVEHAYQGATRCQNMLQQIHGPREWREAVPPLVYVQPWEVPLIIDQSALLEKPASSAKFPSANQQKLPASNQTSDIGTKTFSPNSQGQETTASPSENQPQSKESRSEQPLGKEAEFEKVKASGNQHVQKGEFQDAASCYSTCISLCPDQVACYTNRALCYLKLNKASEAEADCDKALTLQADNPKALYRRALARKMLQHYKLSLQDLVELLKIEPKNTAAKKEMDAVKIFYKEELDKLKHQKKLNESEHKVRKRMKIEEVDEEEEDDKPSRNKAADKGGKSQTKARGLKSTQPASVQKSKTSTKPASGQPQDSSVQGFPSAPRLMKTTPYEFCQAWNSLRPCQGIQPYAEILKQISPANLPSVISNKLDGQMLQIIVRCVYEEMVMKGEVEQGYQILDNLCKVPRFSTVSMFMSGKEKKEVSSVLDILCKTSSGAYSKEDIVRLKKEYSVK